MSSGMRLRTSIRAPTRYGEGVSPDKTATLLQSIRSARKQPNGEDGQASDERNTKIRRRSEPIRPKIAEYNPNLQPAPFPTLDKPVPSGENGTGQSSHLRNFNGHESQRARGTDISSNGQYLENYLASNNARNQIYTRNMQVMAHARVNDANNDPEYMTSESESEGLGVSSRRLAKLVAATPSDPSWKDLSPSLQVEIILNVLHEEDVNWRSACNKLGLTVEDNKKLATLVKRRNRALDREDSLLEEMREKQMRVIKDLDRSAIKDSKVPPQMVLRNLSKDEDVCRSITQSTNRQVANVKTTGLLNAKASEVLTARQYLGRRGLPRRLAGDWGNGLVTIVEAKEDDTEPERFEWKEDLTVQRKRCRDDTVHTRAGVNMTPERIWEFADGLSENTLVNPSNLILHRMQHDPVRDFENNIPWWHSRHRIEPKHVSDTQASFQWKLDQAKREAEGARRKLENHPRREQGIRDEAQTGEVETQEAETEAEAVPGYDYDDTVLFQFINLGGELVPTGVEATDTGLFKGAI